MLKPISAALVFFLSLMSSHADSSFDSLISGKDLFDDLPSFLEDSSPLEGFDPYGKLKCSISLLKSQHSFQIMIERGDDATITPDIFFHTPVTRKNIEGTIEYGIQHRNKETKVTYFQEDDISDFRLTLHTEKDSEPVSCWFFE